MQVVRSFSSSRVMLTRVVYRNDRFAMIREKYKLTFSLEFITVLCIIIYGILTETSIRDIK
jgi:hypothetical protein